MRKFCFVDEELKPLYQWVNLIQYLFATEQVFPNYIIWNSPKLTDWNAMITVFASKAKEQTE